MSRNVVTTELVAEEPLVVVLSHDEQLASYFSQYLSNMQLHVESYSLAELIDVAAVADRVVSAYKVLWVSSLKSFLEKSTSFSEACVILEPYQQKTSIVLPLSSSLEEEMSGELPGLEQVSAAQTECILFFNQHLPKSMFLFGLDIVDVSIENSLINLMCQDLQSGLLYSPSVVIHPQTRDSFVKRSIRYFLQPQSSSVLVRGNSVNTDQLAEKIKLLYQSYYFSPISIQHSRATTQSPTPFTVLENFATENIDSELQHFVQSFPSPKVSKKAPFWNKLKTTSSKEPDHGVEVKQDQEVLSHPEVSTESLEQTKDVSSITEVQLKTEPQEKLEANFDDISTDKASIAVSRIQNTPQNTVNDPPAPYDLNQEIQRVFSDTHLTEKKKLNKRVEKKKTVVKQKTKKRTALFYGGLAFTGVGLGVLSLSIIFVITTHMFKSALASFVTTQVLAQETEDNTWDTSALARLKRLENIVDLQVESYSAVVSLPALEEAGTLIELSATLPEVEAQNTEVIQLTKTFYSQLIGIDSGDSVATAEKLTIETLSGREKLLLLESALNTLAPSLTSMDEDQVALETFSQSIEQKKQSIQVLQQIQPLLGQLLGSDRKRTYAVILQSNQELRPTGGFIEDVALVTFQNGTLTSSKVLNSYQIDKQLAGTVVPPEEITTFLREEDWKFYDSNWDPNFPKTANQITWFLDKSLGTTVDGVITIDLYGIAAILEATGPLDLPEYNEVLTDKNIFDQFEFHSEVSLVDNNKDYRQVVFNSLLARLSSLSPEKAAGLFSSLQYNFENQHMLAAFTDADELQSMKNLGWSGTLLRPNCPQELKSQECIVDTVAQVEANVGTNTANHYLKRSIDHSVSLSASSAAHVRTITLENTAQSDAWPKGPYMVYTRLYVPSSAQLGSVLIDGSPIGESALITSDEDEHKVIGLYVELPIKKSKKITVSYSVPFKNPEQSFTYAFFEQQQPGSGPTPFTLSIENPKGYSPTLIAPQANLENNVISFNKKELGHGFFGVKFEK